MTHDELVALVGHDQRVAADILLERILGRHIDPGTKLSPGERYAADTALVEGQGHLVTSGSAAYLTEFENHLSHRISLETQGPRRRSARRRQASRGVFMTEDIVMAAERLAIEANELLRVARSAAAAREHVAAWPEMLSASRAYVERVTADGLRTRVQGIVGRARTIVDTLGSTS